MDFLPKRDSDLNAYETTFAAKYPAIASQLGIAAENASATIGLITEHQTAYSTMNEKKAESKSAVQINSVAKVKAVTEIRRVAQLVKSSLGYTEAIGRELGIIGTPEPTADLENIKPTLNYKIVGGNIVIAFDKQKMDGVKIYSKRSADANFEYLATDTSSPYEDNSPKINPALPEERQYYAYYILDDEQVGQQSDIIRVTVP